MIALLAVLLVQAPEVPATVAPADTLQQRSGLYLGFGVGPGYVGYRCDGCSQQGGGLAGMLQARAGLAVSPHFTVGLEIDSWSRSQNGDNAATTTLAINYYPVAHGGAFLRGGVGLVSFQGAVLGDGATERGSGHGVLLGIGYDGRFDKRLSLTPMLTVMYQDIGTTSYGYSIPIRRGTSALAIGFGVGLTWH